MSFFESLKSNVPYSCFTDTELSHLIQGSDDRRYALVKRALAKGDLIRIRRGFYCLAEKYRNKPINLFNLAQFIYGPSYISFESALSYHGWIPEAVFTVTSASLKRSQEFNTPLGVFNYLRISAEPFFAGVVIHKSDAEHFFIADPWKAILDYVFAYRKDWTSLDPLIHSLRIDDEFLSPLPVEELKSLAETYKSLRVSRFVSGVLKGEKEK